MTHGVNNLKINLTIFKCNCLSYQYILATFKNDVANKETFYTLLVS